MRALGLKSVGRPTNLTNFGAGHAAQWSFSHFITCSHTSDRTAGQAQAQEQPAHAGQNVRHSVRGAASDCARVLRAAAEHARAEEGERCGKGHLVPSAFVDSVVDSDNGIHVIL